MNLPEHKKGNAGRHHERGILLLECVVYIAVLAVIFAVAYGACFRCLSASKALQQSTADISRALDAGERWRGDVRQAGSVSCAGQTLNMTLNGEKLEYFFDNSAIWRQAGTNSRVLILRDVQSSRMECDVRGPITSWRWEIELKSRQKSPKVRPLFTFQAVPKS